VIWRAVVDENVDAAVDVDFGWRRPPSNASRQ
jgi:hypothetical protein